VKIIGKILILRFGAIGDVVHTLGLVRSLREHLLSSEIHYVTFKAPSELIKDHPDITKVYVLQDKSFKKLFNLATLLQLRKFDLFINLQPSWKTKIFAFIVNAKKTLTYKKDFKMHAVENFWHTAKKQINYIVLDNKISLPLPKKLKQKAKELLPQNEKIVVFNMETSPARQGRLWSIKNWQKLAQELIKEYNCKIILTGEKKDSEEVSHMLKISENVISFSGKLSLAESAAVLGESDLVISGDTGPLHIATALDRKVIGLYGAAPVSRTGPYSEKGFAIKSDLKCVPCNKRKCKYLKAGEKITPCMKAISPEMVLKIIKEHSLL